jgi:hypothetical protein
MRSRALWITAAMMVFTAGSIHAQTETSVSDPPRTMVPVPPLPEIGLRLPHIGLPEPVAGKVEPGQRQTTSANTARRPLHAVPSIVYVLPPVLLAGPPPSLSQEGESGESPDPIVEHKPTGQDAGRDDALQPTGTLTLDLQPAAAAQVFVDGYYVGSTDQMGTTIDMPVGPHNVELKSEGFEPVRFGVQIRQGRSLVYRESLHRIDERVTAAAAPVTLYVIPGCYAGSVPPDAASLPSRCDVSQLKTLTP